MGFEEDAIAKIKQNAQLRKIYRRNRKQMISSSSSALYVERELEIDEEHLAAAAKRRNQKVNMEYLFLVIVSFLTCSGLLYFLT